MLLFSSLYYHPKSFAVEAYTSRKSSDYFPLKLPLVITQRNKPVQEQVK